MYHHHITRAIGQAHVADMQRTAARTRPTAGVRPRHRHRRHAIVAALVAICALAPTADALAQPADSVTAKRQWYAEQIAKLTPQELAAASGTDVRAACGTDVRATRDMITFTNPLGRSRGPGTGAGLL
jgi:hypothetical protein